MLRDFNQIAAFVTRTNGIYHPAKSVLYGGYLGDATQLMEGC